MIKFEIGYDDSGDGFDRQTRYYEQFKDIVSSEINFNTKVLLINNHKNDYMSSSNYARILENLPEKTLVMVNWGYHNRDTSSFARELEAMRLCHDDIYIPIENENEKLFYKKDVPLASLDTQKHVLYLLWDAVHKRNSEELSLFKEIMQYYRQLLPEYWLFQEVDGEEEFPCSKTVEMFEIVGQRKLTQVKNSFDETQDNIENYRRRLTEYNNKAAELSKKIREIETMKKDTLNIKNKYIKHAMLNGDTLSLYTDLIYISEYDSAQFENLVDNTESYCKYSKLKKEMKTNKKRYQWYAGQYRIDINFDDWKIRFFNLDNQRVSYWAKDKGRSEYDNHPHVSGSGEGCLGTLSEMISYAQSNYDIETLCDVLVQYLQSANLGDSAGKYLANWDLIDMQESKNALTGAEHKITFNPLAKRYV